MKSEAHTIEDFVLRRLSNPRVIAVVENWRVEPEIVSSVLINHFREIGIYFVERGHEEMMMKNIIHHLKHSPELIKEVRKAQDDEIAKKRTRHSS